MPVVHKVFEESEEIGDEQVADVQAIDIRISRENDLFVSQALEVVLDIKAAHQVVHLVVFVNDVALQIPHVERLAF